MLDDFLAQALYGLRGREMLMIYGDSPQQIASPTFQNKPQSHCPSLCGLYWHPALGLVWQRPWKLLFWRRGQR